jgi:hypothetical protein
LYSESVLNAFSINKGSGRIEKGNIKAYRRDIYFLPEYTIPELQGTIQVLWQLNSNREREPKGMKQILIKRGCNIPGLRFKYLKGTKYIILLEYPSAIEQTYCLACILLNYQDFFKEKSQVKELIIDRKYKAVFLPKFHYEINLIEIYWGYSKTRYY